MRIAEAFEKVFPFEEAGSIPHLDSTFVGYSATIVQFTADQAAKATDHFRSSSQLLQSTEKDLKAISGVNFEEEVQSLNLFRQHNESCAYAFSMTKQAEDKILDVFRA
jgi:flagellar hook-associated protein FlgK